MRPTWKKISMLAAGLALLVPAVTATAQAYPTRPVTWVVGYPPGGAVDFIARTLTARMSAKLGQTIVIDNRPGAAGIIAASAGSRAAADGYTITSVGNGELVLNPLLYKKLSYDARKDFAAVGPVAKIPFLLAVHSSLPVKDVPELLALVRSKPGEINYASGGIGHPNHLAMELLKKTYSVDLTQVPYKGMAPALQDFLSGAVPVMFIDLATATSQMASGRFRVLAVSTKERLDPLPDIPSLSELGAKDYDVFAWQGLAVPAATPAATIRALNIALEDALKDPDTAKKLRDAGVQPLLGGPKVLDDLVQKDRARWTPIVESLNIKLD